MYIFSLFKGDIKLKLRIHLYIATLSLLSFGAVSKNEPFNRIDIKPSDCRTKQCPLLIGNIEEVLKIDKNTEINMTVHLEDCQVNLKNISAIIAGPIATLKANDKSKAEIICGADTTIHKRIAITDYASRPNIKLRKIGDSYTHLGKIQAGILFLHY